MPSGWLLAQDHDTQVLVLFLCAATAGVGGGNFSSSMANISFFYPERKKGFALGLNAAGGNLGVAVAQLLVPLVMIIGVPAAAVKLPQHEVHLAYAGLMWLPFIALAAVLAWRYMDSLTQAKADTGAYVAALRYGQTWIMSFLYIGTFGSFIGFSFALPLVIKTTFPEFLAAHPFIATYLAGLGFVGALIGSLSRPLGGWLSDRIGGARVTLLVFLGMALTAAVAISGVQDRSFGLFFGSYMVLFLLAGMGNGSTYKMIPAIFAELGRRDAAETGCDPAEVRRRVQAPGRRRHRHRRRHRRLRRRARPGRPAPGQPRGVRLVSEPPRPRPRRSPIAAAHADWSVPALWVFLASYLVFAAVTWAVYLRSSFATSRVAEPRPRRRHEPAHGSSSPATAWSATGSSRRCWPGAPPTATRSSSSARSRGWPTTGSASAPSSAGRRPRSSPWSRRAPTTASRSTSATAVAAHRPRRPHGRPSAAGTTLGLRRAGAGHRLVPVRARRSRATTCPGCFVYRTIDDLEAIAAYAAGRRVGAVVGGGLLGLEAANALRSSASRPTWSSSPRGSCRAGRRRRRRRPAGPDRGPRRPRPHRHADHRARGRAGRARSRPCTSPRREPTSTSTWSCSPPASARATSWPGPAGSRSASGAASSSTRPAAPPTRRLRHRRVRARRRPGLGPGRARATRWPESSPTACSAATATFTGADLSTKLKLLGVDVASFGDAFATTPGASTVTYRDDLHHVYKRLVLATTTAAGCSAASSSATSPPTRCWSRWPGATCPRPSSPRPLIFPASRRRPAADRRRGPGPGGDRLLLQQRHQGRHLRRHRRGGRTDLAGIKARTTAGTSCGGCVPLVTELLKVELRRAGVEVARPPLRALRPQPPGAVRHRAGPTASRRSPSCSPATAPAAAARSASRRWRRCWPRCGSGYILDGEQAALQDTNDHFLANLQRDGTYSVVPRVPGGEITPDQLIAIGEVAQDFGLYTKITGGQRIDLFGARVDQLPAIWAPADRRRAWSRATPTARRCAR